MHIVPNPQTLAGSLLALVFGCASATSMQPEPRERPVRADDMSVAEHRAVAQQHEDKARGYQGTRPSVPGEVAAPNADRVSGRNFIGDTSSGLRVTRSRKHLEHARQHLDAAELLETYEAAECGMSPSDERVTCPLLQETSRIEDIRGGVRIHLVEGANAERVVNHMRCHHAFGRARGFQDMDACPLYLKKLRVRQVAPGVIELTSGRATTAAELQRRARDHVALSPARAIEETPAGQDHDQDE